jgi:hypothetical protein
VRQKSRWVVLGLVVAILIVGGWLLWSGQLGIDISQYFAFETPGYVPLPQPEGTLHVLCQGNAPEAQDGNVLRWAPHRDATGYGIQRGNDGEKNVPDCADYWCWIPYEGFAHPVPETDGTAMYIDSDLAKDTCYEYRVKYGPTLYSDSGFCPVLCEKWAPPGSLRVIMPNEAGTYYRPPGTLLIQWTTARDLIEAGRAITVDILIEREGYGEDITGVIARDVPNDVNREYLAYYRWDPTLPLERPDGSGTFLLDSSPNEYKIIVRASNEPFLEDRSDDWFVLAQGSTMPSPECATEGEHFPVGSRECCPGLDDVPYPGGGDEMCIATPTPQPGAYRGVMIGLKTQNREFRPGDIARIPVDIGRGAQEPLPQEPYFVTGVQTVFRFTGGNGEFVGYENGTVLPDVIRPAALSPDGQSLGIAVGSGTEGQAVEIGNITIGTLLLRVGEPNDRGLLCFGPDSRDTDISARDIPGDVFDPDYSGGWFEWICVVVNEEPALPGDADGDGDVDIFDYNLVVSNFGAVGCAGSYRCQGDADGDGDVDIFDYNLVVSNFGTGTN